MAVCSSINGERTPEQVWSALNGLGTVSHTHSSLHLLLISSRARLWPTKAAEQRLPIRGRAGLSTIILRRV